MAARRKRIAKISPKNSSIINKDIFVFTIIVTIVAVIAYVITYNSIVARLDQVLGAQPAQSQAAPQY